MKHRALALQSVVFATSCYCLAALFAVAVRFPAGRLLFSIVFALICVAAELFSGYVVLRQLWRWSARAAHALLVKQQQLLPSGSSNDDGAIRPTPHTSGRGHE
jgi:hypothetical protein